MNDMTYVKTVTPEDRRQIVEELLRRPVDAPFPVPGRNSELVARRTEGLLRRAPETVEQARQAGVEIECLGMSQLFREPRLYAGVETDWVLAPVTSVEDMVVPHRERQALDRLDAGGVYFPLTYIAHEVEKARTEHLQPPVEGAPVVLEPAQASELVGPVPAPGEAAALGERLAARSTQVGRALRRGMEIAGRTAVAAASVPAELVVGAVGALSKLDPIILGATPALRADEGEPAVWYVLVRWDW
jgi:hypothetical protein